MNHHDQLKAAVALATSEGRIWALLSYEERDEYHRRVKEGERAAERIREGGPDPHADLGDL